MRNALYGELLLQAPSGSSSPLFDLPLKKDGIKTKESSDHVFNNHMAQHVELGAMALRNLNAAITKEAKGVFRGSRRRFEKK